MRTKKPLRRVAIFSLILLIGSVAGNAVSNSKPNLIFIMADDLGYGDLGCYGQEKIKTPSIDRLASGGVRFTQAYAGGPVCTPSRSVLMTGLHNGHTVARDNVPHYHTYLHNEDITLAEVLKNAGYRCGGIGKWSLGDAGTVGRPLNQGFDMWLGYYNQDHAHYYYPEYLDDSEGVEGRMELPGNAETRRHYSHDLMTNRALKFISESAGQGDPFFLYAAYTIPHWSSREEDPTRFPVPSDEPYTHADWSQTHKNYASMVSRLDRDVGRIDDLVAELELSNDTLIIFTSDQGPWVGLGDFFDSNGPLRGGKREVYEGGIRVPFIARWPGQIPSGTVSDTIITFWDMLPTLAEVAGVDIPWNTDGVSVLNALEGLPLEKTHEYLYWDYGHNRSTYHQAVRLGNYKGIRNGAGQSIELYHLVTDLGETRDIATVHPEIVRKIEHIMETAVAPSERYPIGKPYQGSAIWKALDRW